MKRATVLVTCIAATTLVAGAVGFGVGWKAGFNARPTLDLFAAAELSSYVSAVRTSGTDKAYEDALRANLTFNRLAKARDSDPSNQRMYDFDSAVTLARLSKLVAKRGASDDAQRFALEAEAACPATGIKDCSMDMLLKIAQFIDTGSEEPPK